MSDLKGWLYMRICCSMRACEQIVVATYREELQKHVARCKQCICEHIWMCATLILAPKSNEFTQCVKLKSPTESSLSLRSHSKTHVGQTQVVCLGADPVVYSHSSVYPWQRMWLRVMYVWLDLMNSQYCGTPRENLHQLRRISFLFASRHQHGT